MKTALAFLLLATPSYAAILPAEPIPLVASMQTVAGVHLVARSTNTQVVGSFDTDTDTFTIDGGTWSMPSVTGGRLLFAGPSRPDASRPRWDISITSDPFVATMDSFSFVTDYVLSVSNVLPPQNESWSVPTHVTGTWTITGPTETVNGSWSGEVEPRLLGMSLGDASFTSVHWLNVFEDPTLPTVTVDGMQFDLSTRITPEPSALVLLMAGLASLQTGRTRRTNGTGRSRACGPAMRLERLR